MEAEPGEVTEPLDLAMLAALRGGGRRGDRPRSTTTTTRRRSTVTERFFWGFTDDYLELVKQRAYGVHGARAAGSAVAALRHGARRAPAAVRARSCRTSRRRSGPGGGRARSTARRGRRPTSSRPPSGGDPEVYEVAAAVLTAVRKEKALAKVSLRVPAPSACWCTTRPSAWRSSSLAAERRPRGGQHRRARDRARRDEPARRDGARRARAGLSAMRFAEALASARRPSAGAHAGPFARPDPALWSSTSTTRSCTYPTIHVTGTNGKTTAARAAAAVACAHGLADRALHLAAPRGGRPSGFSVCGTRHDPRGVRRRVGAPAALPRARRRDGDRGGDVLRGASPRSRSCGSRTSRSGSASSRSGWAARGTRRTSSPATSP